MDQFSYKKKKKKKREHLIGTGGYLGYHGPDETCRGARTKKMQRMNMIVEAEEEIILDISKQLYQDVV